MVSDKSLDDVLLEVVAKEDYTLVWVNRPPKYGQAGNFVNAVDFKPLVQTIEVAAAVIVDIPAFGSTRRNQALP